MTALVLCSCFKRFQVWSTNPTVTSLWRWRNSKAPQVYIHQVSWMPRGWPLTKTPLRQYLILIVKSFKFPIHLKYKVFQGKTKKTQKNNYWEVNILVLKFVSSFPKEPYFMILEIYLFLYKTKCLFKKNKKAISYPNQSTISNLHISVDNSEQRSRRTCKKIFKEQKHTRSAVILKGSLSLPSSSFKL